MTRFTAPDFSYLSGEAPRLHSYASASHRIDVHTIMSIPSLAVKFQLYYGLVAGLIFLVPTMESKFNCDPLPFLRFAHRNFVCRPQPFHVSSVPIVDVRREVRGKY